MIKTALSTRKVGECLLPWTKGYTIGKTCITSMHYIEE